MFLYQTRRAVFFGGFMKKKLGFYTEIAYFLGLFLLAFGTAMTVYGGFGMSMVVAPAFISIFKIL